jgi:hypothetical protein
MGFMGFMAGMVLVVTPLSASAEEVADTSVQMCRVKTETGDVDTAYFRYHSLSSGCSGRNFARYVARS